MKMRALVLASLAAIGQVGCATSPVPASAAVAVPQDRLFPPALARPVADGGTIVVTRDSGANSSACSARVWINGQPAADVRTSERVTVHVAVGEHIVSAQPNGICPGGLLEVQARVSTGKTVRFRIGYGTNAEFILAPTAF
jgi:hypothetical protein